MKKLKNWKSQGKLQGKAVAQGGNMIFWQNSLCCPYCTELVQKDFFAEKKFYALHKKSGNWRFGPTTVKGGTSGGGCHISWGGSTFHGGATFYGGLTLVFTWLMASRGGGWHPWGGSKGLVKPEPRSAPTLKKILGQKFEPCFGPRSGPRTPWVGPQVCQK